MRGGGERGRGKQTETYRNRDSNVRQSLREECETDRQWGRDRYM